MSGPYLALSRPGEPLNAEELKPLERLRADTRALSDLMDAVQSEQEQARKLLGDDDLFDLVDEAVGGARVRYASERLSKLMDDADRASGRPGEAALVQKRDSEARALAGRLGFVLDSYKAFHELVESKHIDLAKLRELKAEDPFRYRLAREELSNFLLQTPFMMRNQLAETTRDRMVMVGNGQTGHRYAASPVSYRWTPAAVRGDDYLLGADRGDSPAALVLPPPTGEGDGGRLAAQREPWQEKYLELRQAQIALAARFGKVEHFLSVDACSGSAHIRACGTALGPLERQFASETDPVKQAEILRLLNEKKLEILAESKILIARYKKLTSLIDEGKIETQDLETLRATKPEEFEARMTKLRALIKLNAAQMTYEVTQRDPKPVVLVRRPAHGVVPNHGGGLSPSGGGAPDAAPQPAHMFMVRGMGPNGDNVHVVLDLPGFDRPGFPRPQPQHGFNSSLECALVILEAKALYAVMIRPSIDGLGNMSDTLSYQARGQLSSRQTSDACESVTRRRAEELVLGRGNDTAVLRSIRAEAAAFKAAAIEAEKKLSGAELRAKLEELRTASSTKIVGFIREDVKNVLPGVAFTVEEIGKMLFAKELIDAAVERARKREADKATKPAPVTIEVAPELVRRVGPRPDPTPAPVVSTKAGDVAPVRTLPPKAVEEVRATLRPTLPSGTGTGTGTGAGAGAGTGVGTGSGTESEVPKLVPTVPVLLLSTTPQDPGAVLPPPPPAAPVRLVVPVRGPEISFKSAQSLTTLYAQGVSEVQIRLPNDNLVVCNLIYGTFTDSYHRPIGPDVLEAAGIEVRRFTRQGDQHMDVAILCKYPGEVGILARDGGRNNVVVTTDTWASAGGQRSPAGTSNGYTVVVEARDTAQCNAGRHADALALGSDAWHRNLPSAVTYKSGDKQVTMEYLANSADSRLYARTPDGKAYFVYEQGRNIWHALPLDKMPAALIKPELEGRDAAAAPRLRPAAQLTAVNQVPLETLYTQNAKSIEFTIGSGTEREVLTYRSSDNPRDEGFTVTDRRGRDRKKDFEALGVRVTKVSDQLDGNHDFKIEIMKPASFQIASLDSGSQRRVVSRGVWATQLFGTPYASKSYKGDTYYTVKVDEPYGLAANLEHTAEVRRAATAENTWVATSRTPSTKLQYAFSSEDGRVYARSQDGKKCYAFSSATNTWHEVQAGELPVALRSSSGPRID